jgi:hypothetical protein
MFIRMRRELEGVAAKLNGRWAKQAIHLLRWTVPILLLAYLGYCLTRLGWAQVWKARPGGLLFYAVVVLQFYIQPVADLIIYRNLLGVGRALSLLVLLRKRYVNTLLDYSGEVYFFFWAKKNLESKKGILVHAVKDTNVLSASAGLVMVWLALLAVVAVGSVKLPAVVHEDLWTFLWLGSLPLVLVLALFVGGRRVTALSRRAILATFAIQIARGIIQLAAEFAAWWFSGALPSVALCIQFVVLRVVVTRLPLVPSKDLVFVGVGIAAAGLLDVSTPKVAAVLVLMTAVALIQNLALVGLPWLFEQFQIRRRAAQAAS